MNEIPAVVIQLALCSNMKQMGFVRRTTNCGGVMIFFKVPHCYVFFFCLFNSMFNKTSCIKIDAPLASERDGRDRVPEDHHQREVAAHCQVCLRLCHQEGAKQGHRCAQGQHHVRKIRSFPFVLLDFYFLSIFLNRSFKNGVSMGHDCIKVRATLSLIPCLLPGN